MTPTMPMDMSEVQTKSEKVWHSVDDLLAMEPPDWVVNGLVPQRSQGYITGRDGTKKTFIALDMALCLVTGRAFHGHEIGFVNYYRVLFIAGEGAHSFGARITAWCQHNRVVLKPWHKERLLVRSAAVNLYRGGEEYAELLQMVEDREPDLIVVDTLQRSSAGAESNSATDMGIVTARIDALKRASNGGTVLVIAHTGKSDQDARGSSSIEDDSDFVLHVKDKNGQVDIEVVKQKEGRSGEHLLLRAVEVAGSLALGDPSPEPVWSSNSMDNRIRGALLATTGTGSKTRADIGALLNDDGNGAVSRHFEITLSAMVDDGQVLATKTGVTNRFAINPEHASNQPTRSGLA